MALWLLLQNCALAFTLACLEFSFKGKTNCIKWILKIIWSRSTIWKKVLRAKNEFGKDGGICHYDQMITVQAPEIFQWLSRLLVPMETKSGTLSYTQLEYWMLGSFVHDFFCNLPATDFSASSWLASNWDANESLRLITLPSKLLTSAAVSRVCRRSNKWLQLSLLENGCQACTVLVEIDLLQKHPFPKL